MLRTIILGGAAAVVLLLLLVLAMRAVRSGDDTTPPDSLAAEEATVQTITGTVALGETSAVTAGLAETEVPTTETAATPGAAPASLPPVAQPGAGPVRFVQAVESVPAMLNPLLSTEPTTQAVAQLIYPAFVGLDAREGRLTTDGLAVEWRVSPDARVYTYTLRSDLQWSDGLPVTAADVLFTLDAVRDPAIASPLWPTLANVADVVAPTPSTVVVTLTASECATMAAFALPVLPAHRFDGAVSMADAPQSTAPAVGAGPFLYTERRGEELVLTRNSTWPDAPPAIEEFVLRTMPDPTARLAALDAGEVDLAAFDGAWVERAGALGRHTLHLVAEDSFDFVALNLADPAAPQPGQDTTGARLTQQPHPILGEPRVRQALAAAVDYDAAVADDVRAATYRVPGYVLPAVAWAAEPALAPVQSDPTLAGELLDSAGWRDEDGDGLRTRDGTPLALTVLVNNESAERLDAAQALATAWRAVGADVTVEAAAYEDVLQRVLAQQTDAAVLGWDNLGFDPGANPFWHSRHDLPGTGFNFVSYQDPDVDTWLDQARTAPACDATTRADYFRQVQTRVDRDKPYLMLHGRYQAWLVNARWHGVEVGPWGPYASLSTWRLRE